MSGNTAGLAMAWSVAHVHHCQCHGFGWGRGPFSPGDALFGAAIPCICKRDAIAREQAEALRKDSGLGDAELERWTFETFKPSLARCLEGMSRRETTTEMEAVLGRCVAFAEAPKGWLVLQGDYGTGKTHLAFAIAGYQLAMGRGVFAHTLADMLDLMRSGAKLSDGSYERWLETFKEVPLLVIDDLGVQQETQWTDQVIFQVLNHRYSKRLPLVITTNMDLRQEGGRLVSRMLEGADKPGGWSTVVSMPCGDFRRKR